MKLSIVEIECPDCKETCDLDTGEYEAGDIIDCPTPECENAWLVEEDGSLTPGWTEDDLEDDDPEVGDETEDDDEIEW